MPPRKKAKGKTKQKPKKPKPKRKKTSVTRAKKTPRKASPNKAKRTAKAVSKSTRPSTPAQLALPGKRIGVVTHFFGQVSVALIRLESGTLRVGDVIHIRGHTTDFEQKVESLQVDHAPVNEVGPKDDFGLKVMEHVREHDVVFKVQS
jgi:translation elongation factor EF-1alpha